MNDPKIQWFIPAYLPKPIHEGDEPGPEDVLVFSVIDIDSGIEYIPVFNDFNECDGYIATLSSTRKPDNTLAIFAFATLGEVEAKVLKAFGRQVELIIHSSEEESLEETEPEEDQ